MPKNPPRDREAYNAYHRTYQLRRYHERMARWKALLGGKCHKCGSTDRLDIDHIDPATKHRRISKSWYWNDTDVLAELKKCQLLCRPCHIAKHASPHGSIRRYKNYGCRCAACVENIREYEREYRRQRRARSTAA